MIVTPSGRSVSLRPMISRAFCSVKLKEQGLKLKQQSFYKTFRPLFVKTQTRALETPKLSLKIKKILAPLLELYQ